MHTFAEAMLAVWPIVSIALFLQLRSPAVALGLTALGAMLLLPTQIGFELGALPMLGRTELATLGALLGCLLVARESLLTARPFGRHDAVFLLLAFAVVGSIATNTDPTGLPGIAGAPLRSSDAVAPLLDSLLVCGLPFLLGRAVFRTRRDMSDLLVMVGLAGIVYSIVALVEMRFSPQLHGLAYGFHPTHISETYESGSYRPLGFMPSSLAFALFLCVSTIALTTAHRAGVGVGPAPPRLAALGQAGVLVLCRSSAATLCGLVSLPFVWLLRSRAVLAAAMAIALLASLYPVVRVTGLFPTEAAVASAARLSTAQANALSAHFQAESAHLERLAERPLLGWGTPERAGVAMRPADWVTRVGTHGFAGWGALCGLLFVPLCFAWRSLRRLPDENERIQLAGLGLMLGVSAVGLALEGASTGFSFLLAGSVHGLSASIASAHIPLGRHGIAASSERRLPRRAAPARPARSEPFRNAAVGATLRAHRERQKRRGD
jgi:hypothetical protein